MILFHDLRIIYCIVPGTGSNSFWKAMFEKYPNSYHLNKHVPAGHPADTKSRKIDGINHPSHWRLIRMKELIGSDVWNSYKKIAFVRYPDYWTWSIFHKGGIPQAIGEDNTKTYDHFIRTLKKTPYSWFTDDDGRVMVDTIYRTEDMAEICQEYGIRYLEDNVRMRGKSPPKQLNEELQEIMRKKFKREFKHYEE